MISERLRNKKLFSELMDKEANELNELDRFMLDMMDTQVDLIVATLRGIAIGGSEKKLQAAENIIIGMFEEHEKEYFSKRPEECIAHLKGKFNEQ